MIGGDLCGKEQRFARGLGAVQDHMRGGHALCVQPCCERIGVSDHPLVLQIVLADEDIGPVRCAVMQRTALRGNGGTAFIRLLADIPLPDQLVANFVQLFARAACGDVQKLAFQVIEFGVQSFGLFERISACGLVLAVTLEIALRIV